MTAGFKKQPGSFTAWQKDETQLVLYCADQIVGTCHVNIEKYIDKAPVVERAVITASADQPVGGLALRGDASRYPEAFMEFRITVTPNDTGRQSQPGAALRVGSVFEK